MYYAYQITNTINDKLYIGITNSPKDRWQRHKSNARSESTSSRYRTYLYNAMRKHGTENFKFNVIAEFKKREDCELFEVSKIKQLRDSAIHIYNLHDGGTCGYDMRNSPDYEQWKQRLSESAIANSSDIEAKEDWKAKLRKQRKGRTPALGMKHSDEAKVRASEVSNAYWDTQETYARDFEKVAAILALSHKEAKIQFGISTTHYYRLKKRFATNDSE